MRRVFALWASVIGMACLGNVAHATSVDSLVIPGIGPSVPPPSSRPSVQPRPRESRLGGGFIEFMMTGANAAPTTGAMYNEPPPVSMTHAQVHAQAPATYNVPPSQQYASLAPASGAIEGQPSEEYRRQEVDYSGAEKPGTIIIDTPQKFLFLVQPGGRALRYGIGVGRPGFEWAGVKRISRKAEWPDWTPPPEMLLRRPDLPRHMDGGPENPLGARALYLGSSMYRIHGTNEPTTIGQNLSSGCIRMMNEDVIDLYGRVPVGTKVIVM
jgi:lipoprotein-anchoring transpeptidase ErfK/SrfK